LSEKLGDYEALTKGNRSAFGAFVNGLRDANDLTEAKGLLRPSLIVSGVKARVFMRDFGCLT